MSKLNKLTTEMRNEETMTIDQMSTSEILTLINKEDMKIALAVQEELPAIEKTVDSVVDSFMKGGRLFYLGAGTSGRLGILDAVECPPTFRTPPEQVQGLIAGGKQAIEIAVEGAEDSEELGRQDLIDRKLTKNDTVLGIAASGRTPYVIGALKYANEIAARTVSLASNKGAAISEFADIAIETVTGPEVLTGSTRLKAATAHKMVLNMISTSSMIKIGKVYENLMVDVNISNHKLTERGIHIIETITGSSYDRAKETLEQANKEVKTAIVMLEGNLSYELASDYLERTKGYVRKALELAGEESD